MQAIRHKLQRNGEDPDRPLAEDFPNYVAAMVFRYLGLKMPECAFWRRPSARVLDSQVPMPLPLGLFLTTAWSLICL